MPQAERIFDICGGPVAVQRITGWPLSTVKSMADRGFIPARRQQAFMDAMRAVGIDLRPEHWFAARLAPLGNGGEEVAARPAAALGAGPAG